MRSNRLIWILEDEEDAQFVYQEVLGIRYPIRFFATIADFSSALEKEAALPELVIADLRLKDESFLDFLGRDVTATSSWPFIVVSSIDDLDVLRECFKDGALDYLTKPFTRNELIVKVERIFDQPSAHESCTDEITVEPTMLRVRRGREAFVQLTPKELHIFSVFHGAKGRSIPRTHLETEVWGDVSVSTKTLDVHLFHLRGKISKLGLEIRHLPPNSYVLLDQDILPPPPLQISVRPEEKLST